MSTVRVRPDFCVDVLAERESMQRIFLSRCSTILSSFKYTLNASTAPPAGILLLSSPSSPLSLAEYRLIGGLLQPEETREQVRRMYDADISLGGAAWSFSRVLGHGD
ncbi:uncharacterized protein PHACADRAFT_203528 [Phanerochaete carnosa HHB-10118-sp]|uniref:Uncharacterized protein n=1 Tax=Phanerochaete carnosa (strain HHB-10118-sp) TaxID=650164 RepID=K5WLL3_PHACS|nr:uncharacterized protein PHACADRAFT_203528 [Phanerochaete carnosa HHB-10118-sp]EKM60290.1 hypothetical protein PHACADRAFT_203528 [Phanerochaete carnosa HHB-10118-sp]